MLAKSLANSKTMATVTFFHDKRSGSETFPLKLRITHLRKAVHINLDVKLTPEQWDEENERIVGHKKADTLNNFITTKKTIAEAAIMRFGLANDLSKFTASQLKTVVESGGETSAKAVGHKFLPYFEQVRDSKKKKKNTWMSYESSIRKMKEYDPLLETRVFEDIDETYIKKMNEAWEAQGLKTNSRAVHMRNIRAVINKAVEDKLTTTYAFGKFSIEKAPTPKRNLSLEELRQLRDYPIVNEFQEKYRDIFMLCFYMRGINMVDLCQLTTKNIRAGRINYIRSKTGKFYSVKIEPEMKAIFDKYKGQDFLLDICDGAKDEAEIKVKYEGFLQRMDRGLKKIGPYTRKGLGGKKHIKPILPGLSQYWSRHTTATLMANMGYREEIIVCSLGHEHKNKTTNIYIEYNEVEVDKANRALIDFVNSNDMDIQLNEKVAEKAKELAKTMGMSEDELVNKIVQWYFEDNEKDDTFAGEEL